MKDCWFELRFYVSQELLNLARSNSVEAARILYRLKREVFLPVLDKYSVDEFIVLDEIPLREDKENFILLRINVTKDKAELILKEIMEYLKSSPKYNKYFDFTKKFKVEKWSPEDDARNRILSAAKRIGLQLPPGKGWKAVGMGGCRIELELWPHFKLEPQWKYAYEDLDLKVEVFAKFMTKVLSRFTREFLREIPEYIEDRWLMSLFIHLLLNSISIWHEPEVRMFPYV